MFGIGSTELLLIMVVALIVLGPKSLASVSRTLGKAVGQFRRVSTEFQRTLNVEVAQEELKTQSVKSQASQTRERGENPAMVKPDADDLPEDSPLAQAIAKAKAQAREGSSQSTSQPNPGGSSGA